MPIHNGAQFIGAAVDSLRTQTMADWELVAALDRCTDGTERILAGFGDPRIRILNVPSPGGFARALNFGLKSCRTELVARLDHDDVSHVGRLDLQLAAFEARPGLAVLGTAAELIDDSGQTSAFRPVRTGVVAVSRGLLWRNQLIHPSVMFRRSVVEAVGGYDPDAAPILEDYELWLRVIGHGEIDNLGEALIGYRQRPKQMSKGSTVRRQSMRLLARSRKRAAKLMGVPGPAVSVMGLAWFMAQLGHELRVVRRGRMRHA